MGVTTIRCEHAVYDREDAILVREDAILVHEIYEEHDEDTYLLCRQCAIQMLAKRDLKISNCELVIDYTDDFDPLPYDPDEQKHDCLHDER